MSSRKKGAGVCVLVVVAISSWIWSIRFDQPPQEPDRKSYEGKGGWANVDFAGMDVPDLTPLPSTSANVVDVLLCSGRSWRDLEALLGPPANTAPGWKGGTVALWTSAVAITSNDPLTWPTAHVIAMSSVPADRSDAKVESLALVSSLGRPITIEAGTGAEPPAAPQPAKKGRAP